MQGEVRAGWSWGPGKAVIRTAASWVLWPLLLGFAVLGVHLSVTADAEVIGLNITYLSLIALILVLERVMPHEVQWTRPDGQVWPDIAHTLLNKGAVQGLLFSATSFGLVAPDGSGAEGVWPVSWPIWAQVPLGLVVIEFGFYWAHRLAHEWPILWRFHAVHHSAPRLWVVNTGRFHFVDTLVSTCAGVAIILLLGIPQNVVIWGAAIHATIGLLTHCNIEMRFGGLSYVFNTPELHRWHHSRELSEGNRNYGENLMVWDLVFGTYFNAARRPPVRIGIDGRMPAGFLLQLLAPFRWHRVQTEWRRDQVKWVS